MNSWRFCLALALRDLQVALTSRVPLLLDTLGVVGALGLYYYLGQFVRPSSYAGGLGYLAFATAGLAVLRLEGSLLKTVFNLEREQASGTLEILMISPVRPVVVAIGSGVYEMLRGVTFAIVVLLCSRFVFGAGLTLGPRAWAGLACGLLGAILFFFLLMALALSVVVSLRQGAAFASLATFALPVLSGAFFPVRLLPQPLRALADANPLSMAVRLIRDAIESAQFSPLRALLMFGILAALLPLAALLLEWSTRRASRAGTLAFQ